MNFKAACAALVAATSMTASSSGTAFAENCRIHVDTGKCIFVPASERVQPDFVVGDVFPIYEHNMLIDIDRYGLPPVDGSWRYDRSGYDIYRVDAANYTVLQIIRDARTR